MSKKYSIIILVLIILISCFFRFYNLSETPPGLYPDEAMNANDAFDNPGQVFYPENNGREGLYMNLAAVSYDIFGVSVWSFRLTSAVLGTLTVIALYFLTKELFNKKIALFSSFFLSVSFWHVNFSRIGFRAVLLPLILCVCLYLLVKGIKSNKLIYFIGSGSILGLGFYTYSSYRMAFLMFLALFIYYFIISFKNLKKFLINTVIFGLCLIVVASPLLYYFFTHPGTFFGRLGQVSVFSQESIIKALGISLASHLAMFNIIGDFNWRHNLSSSPQLLLPVGIFFLIGLVISLFLYKKKRLEFILLFSWFFSMLLPGVLTHEGLPHALRTIGVIPVCYIFSGIGLNYISKKFSKNKLIIPVLVVLIVLPWQGYKYFYAFAKNDNLNGAFSANFRDIGDYLNKQGNIPMYVIVNAPGTPVPWPNGPAVSAQTPMFIEKTEYNKTRAIYLKPEQISNIQGKAMIIPMEPNNEIIDKIKSLSSDYRIIEFKHSNKAIIINP